MRWNSIKLYTSSFLHLVVILLVLLLLVGTMPTSSKRLRLRRFKSDLDEIW